MALNDKPRYSFHERNKSQQQKIHPKNYGAYIQKLKADTTLQLRNLLQEPQNHIYQNKDLSLKEKDDIMKTTVSRLIDTLKELSEEERQIVKTHLSEFVKNMPRIPAKPQK